MNDQSYHIARLLQRLLQGELSPIEEAELQKWIDEKADRKTFVDQLLNSSMLHEDLARIASVNTEAAKAKFIDRLRAETSVSTKPVHRIHFLKTAWFRYAASVLVLIGIGVYVYIITQNKTGGLTSVKPITAQHGIVPGGDKAELILADGSTIILDSAANGQLAMQAGVRVIKKSNGQLEYEILANHNKSEKDIVTYNTMRTPKGGQYQLHLPDGSDVWLNAASSITYPTVFAEGKREVSITGEAYFEIAKNVNRPFFVKTYKDVIAVLGTSFNVNSYSDELFIKTSLIEGSVKINNTLLKPGQAFINGTVQKTDVEKDIAWKNGVFNLENLSLEQFMRQLSRWYDIKIVYKSGVPNVKLRGEIGRDLNLTEVLRGLQNLGIHYRIEGKELLILP